MPWFKKSDKGACMPFKPYTLKMATFRIKKDREKEKGAT
jgi:hypothetical protein